jgi:hypothetical protein
VSICLRAGCWSMQDHELSVAEAPESLFVRFAGRIPLCEPACELGVGRRQITSFRSLRRPSHFSLLVQRKSNQKEGARRSAFRTSCAPGPRAVTEFLEGASMHLRKTACIVHAALRVDRHRPPLRRGPFQAAHPCALKRSFRYALPVLMLVLVLVRLMLFLRAGARALPRGPCRAALGGGSARRVADRMSAIVSSAHGCAVETTRHPARTRGTWMCSGRFAGVPFLLVTFSLGSQRKVTRPLQRSEALDLASINDAKFEAADTFCRWTTCDAGCGCGGCRGFRSD